MAIQKKRLGTIHYADGENSIVLRASLSNLRELGAAVNMPWFDYIADGHCKNPDEFTKLFYYLQEPDGEGIYEEEDIYDAFFSNMVAMTENAWMANLKSSVMDKILDPEGKKKLEDVAPTSKKKSQLVSKS